MKTNNLFINDRNQIINKVRLSEDIEKVYPVTLNYSDGNELGSTYIIYPFDIAFYQSIVEGEKINFVNSSFSSLNYILFTAVLNKIFLLIESKSTSFLKSKIDSIFYICLRWLQDCTIEYKFPKVFTVEDIDLIICKYCLKLCAKTAKKFTVKDNCICSDSCSNDYTNFLKDELIACMLYSEIEVALLNNAVSRIVAGCKDKEDLEQLKKSKTYLRNSVKAISEYLFSRLMKRSHLVSKENYKSYESKLNINFLKSNIYYKEPDFLKKYKEAYSLGQNDKINDLLNNYKLPSYRKLKVLSKELSPRMKSWK